MTTTRRFLRPRNVILLVFGVPLLALCAWSGWAVHWAFNATPGSPAGAAARLQKLVEDSQGEHADAPNAWAMVTELLKTYEATRNGFYATLPAEPPEDQPAGYTWPPDAGDSLEAGTPPAVEKVDRDLVAALRSGGVFGLAERLRDQMRFVRPLTEDRLVMTVLPELQSGRGLLRAQVADMRFSHGAGNDAAALRDFESALALARSLSMQATIIDRLVGQAMIAATLGELRTELVERPYDESHLEGFEAAMHRQLDGLPSITLQLEGERQSAINCVQIMYSDDGHGDGWFLPSAGAVFAAGTGAGPMPSVGGGRLGNLAGLAMPTKKQTLEKINEFYDLSIKKANLPRAARGGAFNADTWVESLPKGYVVPRLVLPAINRFVDSADVTSLQINATYIMLAVERDRARTGSCPAALADLTPGMIGAVPPDPLNPGGFRYRLFQTGEDTAHRSYLLYSVGADGADNNGAEDPKGKMPGFSTQAVGFDWVVNAPRKARGK